MSGQFLSLLCLTQAAAAAITAETFVGHDGATATAAGNALGVARAKAGIGEDFPVDVIGTAVVVAGGAISVGEEIEVGAGGKAVALSAGAIVARALQEATADGDRIEVLLIAN